ncbi:helix-turn-helix transcriptional regulator [Actinocorallia lasiicapitis]
MRRLRLERGVNLDDAARGSDVGRTTVYRIETASHAPRVNDIRALCRYYEVSEEHSEVLVVLARESRLRGWWQRPGAAVPAWFETYIGLEEEASDLLIYEPELITGLLQTEAYYRSLLRVDPTLPAESDAEQDRRVEVRLKRQERLTGPDAPKLWVILNESALRREVGGRDVMKAQLEHLVRISQPRHITLQVLPFSAGAHAGVDGLFHILGFPEHADPSVVYLQFRRGSLYLEEPEDLAEYTEIYEHLRAVALSPAQSIELIERIAAETR